MLTRQDLLLAFGQANEFKEGDAVLGVAAASDEERQAARATLSTLRVGDLPSSRFVPDVVSARLDAAVDPAAAREVCDWSLAALRDFLLVASEERIAQVTPGLSSEAIAGVVKLMDEGQLTRVGGKVFNPIPGTGIGRRGYFGSRIQPNSPTDDPEEILFSVLEGLSYGCGDVVLGVNPVDSSWAKVAGVQRTLRRVIRAFGLSDTAKYCVLAHIDDQLLAQDRSAEEGLDPVDLDVGFQSIGGTETTNGTFGITADGLLPRLRRVRCMYFETGQGSEVSNGCAEGVDMVTLEARCYGLARWLRKETGNAWTIVNDVAGFIGPEVFATASQLRRACLEDIVMGKLHGLAMGIDVCSTPHMSVSLDELDEVMDAVMPAGPAYMMAVAGKADAMLGYLTTAFRDHARLRLRHGVRVGDGMAAFFERMAVMAAGGGGMVLGPRAGDTSHMYAELLRAEGDPRDREALLTEAQGRLRALQARGWDLGLGHDGSLRPPAPVEAALRANFEGAKRALSARLSSELRAQLGAAGAIFLATDAPDRDAYLRKPALGERLSAQSAWALRAAVPHGDFEAVVILSDGLNAESVNAPQAIEFERCLREQLTAAGVRLVPAVVVVDLGRVRAGYHVGKVLFGTRQQPAAPAANSAPAATIHIIGERPGSGTNTFSAYMAVASGVAWAQGVNHDAAKVVSGISVSAVQPKDAALQATHVLLAGLRPSPGA